MAYGSAGKLSLPEDTAGPYCNVPDSTCSPRTAPGILQLNAPSAASTLQVERERTFIV